MFKTITKDNIADLEYDTFLEEQEVKTNLNNNPFGKYLIYKEKEIQRFL